MCNASFQRAAVARRGTVGDVLTVQLRRLVPAVLAALALPVAAGCGGSSGDSSADPAAVVPARAPVYAEATIGPEGEQREGALAALGKVLDTDDPEAKLREMLRDRGGKGDVEPWIGDRVGAFALKLSATPGGGDATAGGDGAVVAATSDADAAADWVQEQGGKTERHRDVELRLDEKGNAFALVEDRVVAGSRAAVRASIDAAKGDALADADAFRDALDRAGEEGIARAYLAPRALFESAGGGAAGGMLGSLAAGTLTGSMPTAVGAHVHADAKAIRADLATIGGADTGEPADPGFVAGLTGEAWFAAGIGKVGARLQEQLGDSQALLGVLGAQAGLDLEKELLAWMGEGGLFVMGDAPSRLGAALVVQSTDPAATRAAVPKLGRLIGRFANGAEVRELRARGVHAGVTVRTQGSSTPIQIAAAGERFVIALGDRALREAISPSSRLGDGADFRSAAATLGGGLQPTVYLGAGGLATLAGGGEAQRVLSRFTALVATDRGEGRMRAALGLR